MVLLHALTKKKSAASTKKKGKMTIMDLDKNDSAGEDDNNKGVTDGEKAMANVCTVAPRLYARTGVVNMFICHSTNTALGLLVWYVVQFRCNNDLSFDSGLWNQQCHENHPTARCIIQYVPSQTQGRANSGTCRTSCPVSSILPLSYAAAFWWPIARLLWIRLLSTSLLDC